MTPEQIAAAAAPPPPAPSSGYQPPMFTHIPTAQGQAPQFAPQMPQFAPQFQQAPQFAPQAPQYQAAPPAFAPQAPQYQAPPQYTPPAPQYQAPAAPQYQFAPQAPQYAPQAPPAPSFAPTQPAAQYPPQVAAPPSFAPSPGITLTREEYAGFAVLQAQAAQAAQAQREAEAQRAATQQHQQVRHVAQTDGIDRALQLQTERHTAELNATRAQTAQIEAQLLNREKAALLAPKLVGIQWASPEAAADAFAKVNNAFDVSRSPTGEIQIREKGTMLPVDEAMRNMIAAGTLRHYMAASTNGGVSAGGGSAISPGTPGQGQFPNGFQPPQNEGEAAYAEWFNQVAAQRQAGYAPTGLSFGGQFDPFAYGKPAQAPPPQSNGYQGSPFLGQPVGAFAIGRN